MLWADVGHKKVLQHSHATKGLVADQQSVYIVTSTSRRINNCINSIQLVGLAIVTSGVLHRQRHENTHNGRSHRLTHLCVGGFVVFAVWCTLL